MPKTRYRAVFVSDVHLGSRDSHVRCLHDFLKTVRCEHLYLVGDMIDLWQLRRKWHWPQEINDLLQHILKKAKKGAQVTFIPGNHDETFRDYAGFHFGGVEIAVQTGHTMLDGRKLLVMYGDEFDAVVQHRKWLAILGSAAYDKLICANRIINWTRRRFGLPHWSLANYLKRKVKNAIKYIHSYESALILDARRRGFQGVVCGHIHQPVVREENGFLYANTGDWVENCTALAETLDGKLQIVRWPIDETSLRPKAADEELEEDDVDLEIHVPGALPEPVPTGSGGPPRRIPAQIRDLVMQA